MSVIKLTDHLVQVNNYIESSEFDNRPLDLSNTLSTVIAGSSRFISLFPERDRATQRKHQWLELAISPRSFAYSAATAAGVLTVSANEAAKLKVGLRLVPASDSSLWTIGEITGSGGTRTVTLTFTAQQAGNYTAATFPTGAGVMKVVDLPIPEGSKIGEETFLQSGVNWNATEILRKDFALTRTAQGVTVYGNENNMAYQTANAMRDLVQDINSVAIYGLREEGNMLETGKIGGLYDFGTKTPAMMIDYGLDPAKQPYLDDVVVNDLAQKVLDAGGNPSIILCSSAQARVLSMIYRERVTILQDDPARGTYVARVVNAINGEPLTIMAENIPPQHAWVIDPAGFGYSQFVNGAIEAINTSTNMIDGNSWRVLTEMTLEFRNAAQRLALAKNLMDPELAKQKLSGPPTVILQSS